MKRGFTLIELLIVIAIIAILALIAVPNFIEAQTRAKVARVQADFRSLATAWESYLVDNNEYPIATQRLPATGKFYTVYHAHTFAFGSLTTPIAFITNLNFKDPFKPLERGQWAGPNINNDDYYRLCNIRGAIKYVQTAIATKDAAMQSNWSSQQNMFGPIPVKLYAPAPLQFDQPKGKIYPSNWFFSSLGPDKDESATHPWMLESGVQWNKAVGNATMVNCRVYDPTNGTTSSGDIYRFSCGDGAR